MLALRAHSRGGPEQLVYEQAPVPSAGPGEVLIAVHAAAITFAELTWDLSWTTRDGKDRTPVIPSHEMSGTVTGLGAGVAGLAAGDEVIGLIDFARDGAAAEYVVRPGAKLAAKPPSLSPVAAATLPHAALTAWQAVADYAALQPGEQVLVRGAPPESAYSPSGSRRSSAASHDSVDFQTAAEGAIVNRGSAAEVSKAICSISTCVGASGVANGRHVVLAAGRVLAWPGSFALTRDSPHQPADRRPTWLVRAALLTPCLAWRTPSAKPASAPLRPG
jgi:hypothetical protein